MFSICAVKRKSPVHYKRKYFRGTPHIIGFCLPKGAENYEVNQFVNFEAKNWKKSKGNQSVKMAESLEQLEDATSEMNAFLDQTTR